MRGGDEPTVPAYVAMTDSVAEGSVGRRALFLDRDGVINHDTGYLWRVRDFVFKDGIFDICRLAIARRYRLIVVTNQAGIGRGLYSERDFQRLTAWMRSRFEQEAAPMTDVYYCPYHQQHGLGPYRRESFDRKPNPGMILKAALAHDIDLAGSAIIGDKESDMEAGYRAGIPQRYLLHEGQEPQTSVFATCTVNSLTALKRLWEHEPDA
jgi:D-glycero-D-manno-heptose 1,7-bisphosphate phosphatase